LLLIFLVTSGVLMVVSFIMSSNVGDATSSDAVLAAAQAKRNSGWRPLPQTGGVVTAASRNIYYDPTIRNIIQADCAGCHGGAVRNLTDYDNLNAYVQSGMLEAMLQGPMAQFAGNDASIILDWTAAGAPEHAAGKATPAALNRSIQQPGQAFPNWQRVSVNTCPGGQTLGRIPTPGWRPLP
jgi:mono/diheme cytochrome c family protein